MNNKSKSKHINSHKHKEKYSVVVKEYKFVRPDKSRKKIIVNNCACDSYNK